MGNNKYHNFLKHKVLKKYIFIPINFSFILILLSYLNELILTLLESRDKVKFLFVDSWILLSNLFKTFSKKSIKDLSWKPIFLYWTTLGPDSDGNHSTQDKQLEA